MIRLLLADDHAMVRKGFRSLFAGQADMDVIAETGDGDQVVPLAAEHQPDVIALDVSMPGLSGLPLLEKLRRRVPGSAILIVSMYNEEQFAARAMRSGASGFVAKTRPPEELIAAIRDVAAGRLYLSRELAHRIAVESFSGGSSEATHERLSSREYQVFMALVKGDTVTEIARALHLSPKTVSTHKTRILQKLECESLSSLVRYAIAQGLA